MGPPGRKDPGRCYRVVVSVDEPSLPAGSEGAAAWHRHLSLSVFIPAQVFTECLLYDRHHASQEDPKTCPQYPQVQADCMFQRSSQNIYVFITSWMEQRTVT